VKCSVLVGFHAQEAGIALTHCGTNSKGDGGQFMGQFTTTYSPRSTSVQSHNDLVQQILLILAVLQM
jgi:hypothetical protein